MSWCAVRAAPTRPPTRPSATPRGRSCGCGGGPGRDRGAEHAPELAAVVWLSCAPEPPPPAVYTDCVYIVGGAVALRAVGGRRAVSGGRRRRPLGPAAPDRCRRCVGRRRTSPCGKLRLAVWTLRSGSATPRLMRPRKRYGRVAVHVRWQRRADIDRLSRAVQYRGGGNSRASAWGSQRLAASAVAQEASSRLVDGREPAPRPAADEVETQHPCGRTCGLSSGLISPRRWRRVDRAMAGRPARRRAAPVSGDGCSFPRAWVQGRMRSSGRLPRATSSLAERVLLRQVRPRGQPQAPDGDAPGACGACTGLWRLLRHGVERASGHSRPRGALPLFAGGGAASTRDVGPLSGGGGVDAALVY